MMNTIEREGSVLAQVGQLCLLFSYVLLWPIYAYAEVIKKRAMIGHFTALLFSFLVLLIAFVISDTTIVYVAAHSHTNLPLLYRLSAVYGGHSGSLFLFILMMSAWVCIALRRGIHSTDALKHYSIIMAGLLSILVLFNNPFSKSLIPLTPKGLNPLLQDMGMMIHPPVLYLGYVASIVPFILVISAPKLTQSNIHIIQKLLRYSLFILTLGIVLGSWWSYRVLGWGGYWAWDPVENASLLPWIAQLGLYHAIIAGHREWIKRFAIIGFLITIIATMLIRGGMMVSVHTFAANTQIFSIFAIYVVALSLYSVFQYVYLPKESTSVSWVMRFQYFSTFFFIGFFLLTIVLPMLYELLYHTPLILQPAFFKKLTTPFILLIFYGMSVYLRPTIIAYAVMIITSGVYYFYTNDWQSAVAIGSGIGILTTYLYWKSWNLPHATFITMVILMLLNAQQSFSEDIILRIGDSSVIHGVEIMLDTVSDAKGSNYIEKQATIILNGERLYPSIRYFPVNDTAIAHTDTRLFSYYEWHVIMGAQLEDGTWSMQVHCQYWLRWIWGFALLTALAFFTRSQK